MSQPEEMYQCQTTNCGYIYDPDKGERKGKIPKGVQFKDLPDEWRCPVCGATRASFRPLAGPGSVHEENTLSQQTTTDTGEGKMKKYRCLVCGYEYNPENGDPDNGVEAGTAFENIPDNWVCPVCGAGKDEFEEA